jgi:hypothetical protein
MKICPICGLQYLDEVDFCKKCKVVLIEKPTIKPEVPTNYKRLFLMILYTFAFIAFVALLYWILVKVLVS